MLSQRSLCFARASPILPAVVGHDKLLFRIVQSIQHTSPERILDRFWNRIKIRIPDGDTACPSAKIVALIDNAAKYERSARKQAYTVKQMNNKATVLMHIKAQWANKEIPRSFTNLGVFRFSDIHFNIPITTCRIVPSSVQEITVNRLSP